jgi:hypothetical protein
LRLIIYGYTLFRSLNKAICVGPVPQQPPMTVAPASTHLAAKSAYFVAPSFPFAASVHHPI